MISKASQLQHVCIGEWSNAHFRGYIGVWLFRTDMTRVWSEIWTFPWASLPIMDSRTFFVKYLLFHTKQLVIERDKDYLKEKLTLFILAKRIHGLCWPRPNNTDTAILNKFAHKIVKMIQNGVSFVPWMANHPSNPATLCNFDYNPNGACYTIFNTKLKVTDFDRKSRLIEFWQNGEG